MSLALNSSVARLFALEGAELNERGSRSQPIGRSVYARGLPDNWTIYPGRFTGGPRTELLCVDRTLGEAQLFDWQGESLRPLCTVLTGWDKNVEFTIARLSPQPSSFVLRFDRTSRDLDILQFAGHSGFRIAKKLPNGHTYRALNGQTQAFSHPIKPGNYINSGLPEFLVHDGLWCRLLVLDPVLGFVERVPNMTGLPLRGIVVAGHFTSTGETQIFNVNNQPDPKIANTRQMRDIGRPPLYGGDNYYGEANFYRIDPNAGLVPLGPRITGLEKLWQNTPWKIYPNDPPPGELTTLIFRGGGTGFLRHDKQTGLAQVGARIPVSPGVYPPTLQTQVVCGNFTGRGTEFLYYEPSTFNPTGNALTDFDMVLASSEGALNRQLSRSWRTWSKIPIEVFYNFDANRKFKVTKTGMEALPGPIRVDLSEPDARLDQIRVKLAMMQGRVVYYNDGELTEYKFDTWEFSFLMNLDKSPVDMNFLASIDPAGAAAAKQTIAKSGLPDSVFSIECLFLKATDRESLADGNMTVTAPEGAPDEAQNIMKRCVTLWRHAHEPGRFLLGTATRRIPSQAVPTFTVTDVAFQVHPEFRRPGGGSLAWLGMMEGHQTPNLNAARTKLTDPWMRTPSDHPGLLPEIVMGIGRGMFMDRYLIARFAKAIGKEATFGRDQGRPQWTFTGADSARRTSDDIIRRIFSQNTTWTLRLTIEPHSETVAITGEIVSQVNMDGYIHLTGLRSEYIHTRGRQKFNGSIQLKEDSSSGHFTVKPTLWHGLDGGIAVEEDETKGGAGVLTFFESTFTGSSTAERLTNGQRALLNGVMNHLSAVIKGLNLEFTQQTFIPPGGGVFSFSNPKFSQHGDLLLEAVYKDS